MNHRLDDVGRELASEALFDEGVEAARNACVAGASIASAAVTAASWYENPLTGTPALLECMRRLTVLPFAIDLWIESLRRRPHPVTEDPDFAPGFGFVDPRQATAVVEACTRLVDVRRDRGRTLRSAFFLQHRIALERASGPLNAAGLAALFFADDDLDEAAAERMFLLWRMETAIEQAQRARRRGVAHFPFFSEAYVYEGARPPERRLDLSALRLELGLV